MWLTSTVLKLCKKRICWYNHQEISLKCKGSLVIFTLIDFAIQSQPSDKSDKSSSVGPLKWTKHEKSKKILAADVLIACPNHIQQKLPVVYWSCKLTETMENKFLQLLWSSKSSAPCTLVPNSSFTVITELNFCHSQLLSPTQLSVFHEKLQFKHPLSRLQKYHCR